MNNGRRVELDVTYNNAPFAGQVGAEIESLTYVDNAADDSDSIDITLDAQDSKWLHGWLPEEGATLRPRIIGRDWHGPGATHVMECGLFILDDVAYQDAPTTLQVGGVSKPSDTDFSELERETIWKNTSMQSMLKEQEKQGKRLEVLEGRDGEKWRKVMGYIATAIVGVVLGYLFKKIGM